MTDEPEKNFRDFLIEERERRFNELLPEIYSYAKDNLNDGCDVPAMICALIYTAKRIYLENQVIGEEFFEKCVTDILEGGEGLHIHKPLE